MTRLIARPAFACLVLLLLASPAKGGVMKLLLLTALATVIAGGCASAAYVAEPPRASQSNQTNFAGQPPMDPGIQAGGSDK